MLRLFLENKALAKWWGSARFFPQDVRFSAPLMGLQIAAEACFGQLFPRGHFCRALTGCAIKGKKEGVELPPSTLHPAPRKGQFALHTSCFPLDSPLMFHLTGSIYYCEHWTNETKKGSQYSEIILTISTLKTQQWSKKKKKCLSRCIEQQHSSCEHKTFLGKQ